jgi:uncharacterized membrane protein
LGQEAWKRRLSGLSEVAKLAHATSASENFNFLQVIRKIQHFEILVGPRWADK